MNSREKFSSSRVGERRRKLLMRVSTFGAFEISEDVQEERMVMNGGPKRNDRNGSWSPVAWHLFGLFVPGQRASWLFICFDW